MAVKISYKSLNVYDTMKSNRDIQGLIDIYSNISLLNYTIVLFSVFMKLSSYYGIFCILSNINENAWV